MQEPGHVRRAKLGQGSIALGCGGRAGWTTCVNRLYASNLAASHSPRAAGKGSDEQRPLARGLPDEALRVLPHEAVRVLLSEPLRATTGDVLSAGVTGVIATSLRKIRAGATGLHHGQDQTLALKE